MSNLERQNNFNTYSSCANILVHGLYTCIAMRQEFTHVSSKAKGAFGINPLLLNSRPHFPLTSPAGKAEGAVLVRYRLRRAVKAKLFLQRRWQVASRFHIMLEY